MKSFTARLDEAYEELVRHEADPLLEKVSATVRGMEAVATNALLDLVGLPPTTSNARRLALIMKSLGFVPIKSRRFMPGGWRNTVSRGWALPMMKQNQAKRPGDPQRRVS